MKTEELEALLQAADERDNLEFKAAMSWAVSLVKDILAMSNLQDGGIIVVGVADGTFERQGVSQEQADTFAADLVRDAVAPYADPHVELTSEIVSDESGQRFAVITVSPFADTPVICKRDGHDLQQGTIYYRSKSRRPSSARIANSTDMRSVIDFAVVRRMEYYNRLGISISEKQAAIQVPAGYDYDAEIEDLK